MNSEGKASCHSPASSTIPIERLSTKKLFPQLPTVLTELEKKNATVTRDLRCTHPICSSKNSVSGRETRLCSKELLNMSSSSVLLERSETLVSSMITLSSLLSVGLVGEWKRRDAISSCVRISSPQKMLFWKPCESYRIR
eukprot:TRINITY_DN3754_c0_g1_i3.p1 TRINITY_DN3754_c0_g1~~TRINITY_DN3754_c0_g1_i3.p1  ORF type:complete len:140 (+),score=5.33 TRINITY_DN3754_c0_g1_i3:354-773(+)